MNKTLLTLLPAFFIYQVGQSQIVGGAAYLKGVYVEIGVDSLGGFEGADTLNYPGPAGLHSRSNTQYMGFVANPQMDGWVNYDGDFFTPGTPENGWGIEIVDNSGTVNIHASNNRANPLDIPGAFTGYTNVGGLQTLNWSGNFTSGVYDLDINIEYTLQDSALYYTTTVTVSNNGDPIDVLYYYRNIDPDNNVTLTFDYTTTNTILSQPTAFTNLASVRAEQTSPWLSGYTLSANDSNARVAYGGFSNRDASDIWNGTGGMVGTIGAINYADEAIALACRMDTLFAFRSARTFSFESSFSGGISTAVNATSVVDGFDVYPNPAHNVLNIRSKETVNKVFIYNTVGVLQYQGGNNNVIDISSLRPGVYTVVIETANGSHTKRIVKQ